MLKLSISFTILSAFATLAPTMAAPTRVARHPGHDHDASGPLYENALAAQKLNAEYDTRNAAESCTAGDRGCINGAYAQCANGKWSVQTCPSTTSCAAWPNPGAGLGPILGCFTSAETEAIFMEAGVEGSRPGGAAGGSGGASGGAPAEEPPTGGDPSEGDYPSESGEGEEDIPECEDDEYEGRAYAEDDEYEYFYRRQLDDEPLATGPLATLPAPSSTAAASSAAASATAGAPAASSSAPATQPAGTPTAAGEDSAVTTAVTLPGGAGVITIVHTVTTVHVHPSGCPLADGAPALPAGSAAPTISSDSAAPTASSVEPSRTFEITAPVTTTTQTSLTTVTVPPSASVTPTPEPTSSSVRAGIQFDPPQTL